MDPDSIYVTGNTVIDAVQNIASQQHYFPSPLEEILAEDERDIIILTTHRRENMGEKMRNVFAAVYEIAKRFPRVEVVFPVHLNPRVKELADSYLADRDRIHLIEPLNYSTFVNLLSRSTIILTDSGGIQEEAPSLDIPVVLLRDTTERPEAIEAGTVLKADTSTSRIVEITERLLREEEFYRSVCRRANPYGDGRAALRIVGGIISCFGLGQENDEIDEFTSCIEAR